MTEEQIRNTFRYHKPVESKAKAFESIRAEMSETAVFVAALCPDSHERHEFLSRMQGAQMWAHASIDIHGHPDGG